MIATQVRPTASPLPFSVCTYSDLPFPDLARIDARRLAIVVLREAQPEPELWPHDPQLTLFCE